MVRKIKTGSLADHAQAGLRRREILQIGYSSLIGMGLTAFLNANSAKATARLMPVPKAKSVLLMFLTGGPCQLDTFDPKPDAPAEVRGPFGSIETKLVGVRFAELLPEMAARADRFAVIRSMAYPELPNASHELATPLILSGTDLLPPGVADSDAHKVWPCYSGALRYLRPNSDGIPSGMVIPNPIPNLGSDAGLLGPRYDPWLIDSNPTDAAFGPEKVGLSVGAAGTRLNGRRRLLERFDDWRRIGADELTARRFDTQRSQAYQLLDSGRLANAFDLRREDPKLRDRYGRHIFGQTLLLARRLIQAGIPMIQANMGIRAQWDFHTNNEARAAKVNSSV